MPKKPKQTRKPRPGGKLGRNPVANPRVQITACVSQETRALITRLCGEGRSIGGAIDYLAGAVNSRTISCSVSEP